MEHFEDHNINNKKQKNVYLLHLDAPRILLIGSIVIGLLVTTFLVGMHFVGDSADITDPFNRNQSNLKQNGPQPGSDELTSANLEKSTSPVEEKLDMPLTDGNEKTEKQAIAASDEEKLEVLNKDNIEEVISPINDKRASVKKPRNVAKAQPVKKTVKNKTQSKKQTIAKSKNRKRSNKRVKAVNGTYNSKFKPAQAFYQIQVASFDKKSKAHQEARNLKKMNYKVFIDDTIVNNKKFYRVRIGPINSKQESLHMLNKIQANKRYENSYMVKER